MDLVSIVMPFFNAERYIKDSIKSVMCQSYTNWELILINDQSSDSSLRIVREFAEQDSRLVLIDLEKNAGPANARNVGLKASNGQYVAFLDSDDKWMADKLKIQMILLKEEGQQLSYSGYYIIDHLSNRVKKYMPPASLDFNELLKSNFIGNLTGILERELALSIGFENEGHEDYIFWLKALTQVGRVKGVQQYLGEYRQSGDGISHNKFRTLQWQWKIYRKYANQSFWKSLMLMFFYTYYGLTKYKTIEK